MLMPFQQKFERESSGFYPGQQSGQTPSNGVLFNVSYQSLFKDIPPNRQSVIATSLSPLTFPAPANAQLVVSVEINGVIYEGSQIEYDPVMEEIIIRP